MCQRQWTLHFARFKDHFNYAFCLSLDHKSTRLVLTQFSELLHQDLSQALKKSTYIPGIFVELLTSVYLSSLAFCLITNDNWTRSIQPNKLSETFFQRRILSVLAVSLFRDPSWVGTTWWNSGRSTEKIQIEDFDYIHLVHQHVLIFMPFSLYSARLYPPIKLS